MSALVALINACAARFRPHVWGSFFIILEKIKPYYGFGVFVPMFGDLFLLVKTYLNQYLAIRVFVPMFGDLFLCGA